MGSDASVHEEIRRLYDLGGPFATIYLPIGPPSESSAQRAELAWRHIAEELMQRGACEDVVDALAVAVQHRDRGGGSLCAVSAAGAVQLEVAMEIAVDRPVASWDTLPRLVPLLSWIQTMVPHVVVLADRVGADLAAVTLSRLGTVETLETVEGDPDVTRSKPGGWSQRRFQQRAENQWEENARAVAEEVAAVAEAVSAELIVVAGDVRAVQFLNEHLPSRWADRTSQVHGARDENSLESVAAETVRLEADIAAKRTVGLLKALRSADSNGQASRGVDDTLAALRQRRVETLLVADQSDAIDEAPSPGNGSPSNGSSSNGSNSERVWFALEDPVMVSATPEMIRESAMEPVEGPLPDVALRAALESGAEIRIVPPHALGERMASINRFSV